MSAKPVTCVTLDFDTRFSSCIGVISFWRGSGIVLDGRTRNHRKHLVQPRTVARALEAQRLMLAKIEKAGQK